MYQFYRIRIGHIFVVLLYVGLGGVLLSCGGTEPDGDTEWIVREGALTLEQDLLVGDDQDFYFGSVDDLAVQVGGRVYVADGEAHHIKVLSSGGALSETIGREGEGPGEFEDPDQVVLARADSLYVLDDYRVSVFTPDHEFAYGFNARTEERRPSRLMVPDTHPGYVLTYPPPNLTGDEEEGRLLVQRMGRKGVVGDTLFAARSSRETYTEQTEDGRIRTYYNVPFTRSPHFAVGPSGTVRYAWNDSVRVTSFHNTGRRLRTMDIPFESVPVTEADRERVMEEWSDEKRAILRNVIRDTKPAFDQFLVDDQGRYWFGRPTAHPDSTEWWVADPEEKRVATTRMADDVSIFTVRDEAAYGRTTTADGAPAVVRYRVRLAR